MQPSEEARRNRVEPAAHLSPVSVAGSYRGSSVITTSDTPTDCEVVFEAV